MRNYPNPCDTCQRCTNTNGCDRWKIRYLHRQKLINAYAQKFYGTSKLRKVHVFLYEHPDVIRRYLEKGPCSGCKCGKTCDIPCAAYWNWWDARMEWLRRRLGR